MDDVDASALTRQQWLDAFPTPALVVDARGCIRSANEAAVALFGDNAGLDFIESLVAPGWRPACRALFRQGIETGQTVLVDRAETSCLRNGGDSFVGEVSMRRLGADVLFTVRPLATMSMEPPTAQMLDLRQAHARFSQLVGHIREVVWMRSADRSQMLFMSAAYESVWGRSVASAYQHPSEWAESIHPDDRARVVAASENPYTDGAYDEIYRVIRPDGSERWIHDHAFVIRDEDGDPVRIGGVAEDITELRKAEQQIAATQKLDAMGRLAAGIAHDFNNLLSIILSTTELVGLDLGVDHPLYEDIQQIRQAGFRASSLTRQLLAFSSRRYAAAQSLDMNALLESVSKLVSRLTREDIEVRLRLAPGPVDVFADAGEIEQIVFNLVVNARDAMSGPGTLLLSTRVVLLDEIAAEPLGVARGRYAALAVSDTGAGMDRSTQKRIFEPFFTTKPEGKGTGLGLATVHSLVKHSKGGISVWSEPGVGSTFTVFLPEHSAAASGDATVVQLSQAGGESELRLGNETVLLVEDDPFVRHAASAILTRLGYRVITAEDALDALQLAHSFEGPIDLLLTDVIMPVMSGVELAQRLLASRRSTKVLYMTGYLDDSVVEAGDVLAGVALLQKPLTMLELADRVRAVLDGEVPQALTGQLAGMPAAELIAPRLRPSSAPPVENEENAKSGVFEAAMVTSHREPNRARG